MAQFIEPFLNDTVIAEMTCVGSLLLIGLAFNLIGVAKLKIMNFIPAILCRSCWCRFSTGQEDSFQDYF